MSKSSSKKIRDAERNLQVLMALDVGDITAREAANFMECSLATAYNRLHAYQLTGKAAVKHGNTGRAPVNKLDPDTYKRLEELLSTKYRDFNPQQVLRYLKQDEGIEVSRETVRRLMRKLCPRQPDARQSQDRIHNLRRRRSRFGELIQIDGSPHNWLLREGPDPDLICLVIFIDDATGIITDAVFTPTETSEAYLLLIERHVIKYGIPQALYSDRHSIFTAALSTPKRGTAKQDAALTQYQRVCKELGIEPILAYSPSAKGRVERAFQTLQKRWPQELRLKGAKTIEDANAALPELLAAFNEEFGVTPFSEEDAHVSVPQENFPDVRRLCAQWTERVLSKRFTCQYAGEILEVTGKADTWFLKGATVNIVTYRDGLQEMVWLDPNDRKRKLLSFKKIKKNQIEPIEEYVTSKTIDEEWKRRVRAREETRKFNKLLRRELKVTEALRRREAEVGKKEEQLATDTSKEKPQS